MKAIGVVLMVTVVLSCRSPLREASATPETRSSPSTRKSKPGRVPEGGKLGSSKLDFGYVGTMHVRAHDGGQTSTLLAQFVQKLQVDVLDKDRVVLDATLDGPCKRREHGVATAIRHGGLESNTDEDGNGFFVDQYVYKRDAVCWIYARLEKKTRARVVLEEAAECNPECPFKKDAVMRRTIHK